MPDNNKCPSCGAELPGDLPAGLCAACLLAVGLPTEPASEKEAARPTIRLSLPPLAEKPGDRIGRYKLLQQIGEGGCGVVYMAEQQEPVKRRVALKVIKPGMDTKEVLGRFEAERQALALMDHANIAKVFDAGATETGRPFFVMELVRGIPITRYCDENRLNTDQRLELFIQVCQAIQHAHQKGIIHRDIKPSNILVADHDGVPVPKIIDFGIAKATSGQTLTDKTVFTALEQFIGTPAYMSPEQAKLSGLDIDTRSDIYSLGVLLYELLTGKTPFDAKRLFEAGFDEIRRIIREEEPQRPSTKLSTLEAGEQMAVAKYRMSEPPKLLRIVKGDLDWIVMKCLEKDRNRRYETANGLAAELTRFLNNEPVTARPPSQIYRFQKMVRRNRLAVAAAGAIAGVLLIGIATSAWQAARALRAERLQSQLREQAEKSSAKEVIQRQLADEERSRANRSYSESLIREGDLLGLSGRWHEAEQSYETSRAILTKLGDSTVPVELAMWEKQRCFPPPLNLLGAPDKGVSCIAISHDGRFALAGRNSTSKTAEIELWNLLTGTIIKSLPASRGAITCIAFSADGHKFISGSEDSTLVLWDSHSGKELNILHGHQAPISWVGFSPDGKWIVSGSKGYTPDGESLGRSNISTGAVLRMWEVETGKEMPAFSTPQSTVNAVSFSPDGKRILVGNSHWQTEATGNSYSARGGIYPPLTLFDCETGQGVRVLEPKGSLAEIVVVAISHNGKLGLSGQRNGIAKLWDLETGIELKRFDEGSSHEICNLNFSISDKEVAAVTTQGIITFWDVETGIKMRSQQIGDNYVPEGMPESQLAAKAVFSKDARMVLWGTNFRGLSLWGLKDKPVVRKHIFGASNNAFVGLSPDGMVGLSLDDSYDNIIWLWDVFTDSPLLRIKFEDKPASAVFSPDGTQILVGTAPLQRRNTNDSLILWDIAANQKAQGFPAAHAVTGVAFSADGRFVISCGTYYAPRLFDPESADGAAPMRLWDANTGKLVQTFRWENALSTKRPAMAKQDPADFLRKYNERQARTLTGVALTPDKNRVMTISDDSTVGLWDVKTGLQIRSAKLNSQAPPIHYAKSSQAPIVILAAGQSSVVQNGACLKQLEVETLKEIHSFPQITSYGSYAASIFGGRYLLSNEEETRMSLWDLQTGRRVRTITPALMGTAASSANGKQFLCLARTTAWSKLSGQLMFCDFDRPNQIREFESRLQAARKLLAENPHSPEVLAVLGEWYAFRGINDWAVELLEAARADGAEISSLSLARACLKKGDFVTAKREFKFALDQKEAPESYLRLCINSSTSAGIQKEQAIDSAHSGLVRHTNKPTDVITDTNALRAQDISTLLSHLGKEVTVEGRVSKVLITSTGRTANIEFIGPDAGTLLIWSPTNTYAGLATAFGQDLDAALNNRIVRVTGRLAPYRGGRPDWKDRLQITLDDASNLNIVAQTGIPQTE